jgi:chaperone LolA
MADSRIEGTALAKVVAEISARQEKIETLRADFRQEKTLSLLANSEVSTGRFVFEKPNRVLWSYQTPKPVTMLIADGWLTTYYPELKKAEKLEVKRFEDRIFRYVGASSGALRELGRYFDFKFIDDRTKTAWVLELKPKTETVARRVRKLTIWIDRSTYLTTKFEYVEGDGDVTRYEFSNIETNVALPANQFTLELPSGVRVEQVRLNR